MPDKPKKRKDLLREVRILAEGKGALPEEALRRMGAREEANDAVPEDVCLDVVARREANALYAEVQTLRDRIAQYEQKYRTTFEEFQASVGPEMSPDQEQDYWEWSRLAEEYRLRYEQWENAVRRASSAVRFPESEEGRGGGTGGNVV